MLYRSCIWKKNYTLPTRVTEISEGVLPKFCILIKKFCFQSNLDQIWSDCSSHEYYNLTKFGQVRTPFLKNLTSRNMSLAQLSGVLNSSSYYILVSLIHTYGFIRKMKIFYTLVDGRLIVWIG